MIAVLQKIARFLTKGVAGILAFTLTLLVLIVIGLQGFVWWLNTDGGGAWMTTQVNQNIQNTGYEAKLDQFALSGLWGLKAKQMELLENKEPLILGKDISLSINPAFLSFKHLDISLNASQLHILKMPRAAEGKKMSDGTAFILPETYFKTAQVNITIKDFYLSEEIIEGGFHSHIKIKQDVELLDESVAVKGRISLKDTQSKHADYIPYGIQNALKFGLKDQIIHFDKLFAQKDNYKAAVDGRYDLKTDRITVNVNGEWLAPKQIDARLTNPVNLKGFIDGRINDFSGGATLSTQYQSAPVGISAKIDRKDHLISLNEIIGNGASIDMTGAVTYDIETFLASGKLDTKIPNLKIIQKFIPTLALSGSATAQIELTGQNDKQATLVHADVRNLKYNDYTVQHVKAQLRSSDIKRRGNISADITLSKGRAGVVGIEKSTLKITPKQDRYGFVLSGKGFRYHPFSINAEGSVQVLDPFDVVLNKADIKMGTGHINASGRIARDALDIKLKGQKLVLSQMPFVDLASVPITVDQVSGTVSGSLEKPELNASYNFHPTLQEQYGTSFTAQTKYVSGILTNELTGKGRGIKTLEGHLDFPLAISLDPFVMELTGNTPLQGNITAQSDLQALSGLFLNEGYIVEGALDAGAQISGTLSAPLINGAAKFKNGLFVDTYNDLQLMDIAAYAMFSDRSITIESFTAKDGEQKGTMTLTANIGLEDPAAPDLNASLQMKGMHLLKNENYDVWLNANVDLKTAGVNYLITGTLSPQEASIRIPDHFASPIPQLNIIEVQGTKKPTDRLFEKTKLDIKFKTDNKFFVSGRGLDAELQGNLDVTGTLKAPLVEGNLNTLRGRYEEFGRRFVLDKAILRFQGAVPPSPYLDIEASTKVDDITGKILITNSVENPKIKLASTPSLPEDEVLSLILFGKDIQKISPFQAVQLANALRKFSGKGDGIGFDPLNQLQSFTGLDDIRVEGVGTEDASVGAGKYISEKVYMEVEQGTVAGSGAASIEIEVTPNISIESKATQSGESDIGVFWEWGY